MLIGPRQCGKTTLVRLFVDKEREYVTLDDDTVLESARSDPAGFVRGFDLVTIDEVQRTPELLRAIKQSVDSDRRAGRFLLNSHREIEWGFESPTGTIFNLIKRSN
jgi:predicted AAA+ superfamily ATPase